jgi:hypothetical protein
MIGVPILALLTAAAQSPTPDLQSEAVEVESTLDSVSLTLLLSYLGTCDDLIREAEVNRLKKRYRRIKSEAERLFGREMMFTIHIVEGDSCSQSRFYERNVRAARRSIDGVRKRLRTIAKAEPAAGSGTVSERVQP